MKITAVEPIWLSIPFTDGGRGEGLTPTAWRSLDIVLVRIDTDAGITGWGEAFGYFVAPATAQIITRMIAPVLIGQSVDSPADINLMLQRRLALFGRYGITMFAISGVDIALWDIAAKASGVPLADLLGGTRRATIPAYASLVRYGDAGTAARFSARAADEGYGAIKLHEITLDEIAACRRAVGTLGMAVDVNCAWDPDEARRNIAALADLNALWLEEPLFPPEDIGALATLGQAVPLAAGENLCTAHQFAPLIRSGAVTFAQPSVTKVGGITEFIRIADMASAAGMTLMPHSPYFGPGYHATLHLCAALGACDLFEYLYVWPDALPDPRTPLPRQGMIALPDGPGLGFRPDPDIVARYRVRPG